MEQKLDLFKELGIFCIVCVTHVKPDRDSACSMFSWLSVFGIKRSDLRIQFIFVPKGDEIDLNQAILCTVNGEQIEIELSDPKVLVIHFDTGKKFEPFDMDQAKGGKHVFYYDHHEIKNELTSACGLVFRAHSDLLSSHVSFKDFELMAKVVDYTDNNKPFDLSSEYEMGCLMSIATSLRGNNYRQENGETARDDEYYYESVKTAFGEIVAWLSLRKMYRRNLNEIERGEIVNIDGLNVYVGKNFSVPQETIRLFIQRHYAKRSLDCIVTSHRDTIQLIVNKKTLIENKLIDTAEIAKRICAKYPEIDPNPDKKMMYVDHRGFLIYIFRVDLATVDDLIEILTQIIKEKQEALQKFTQDGDAEIKNKAEAIACLNNNQNEELQRYLSGLDPSRQRIALGYFTEAIIILEGLKNENQNEETED